MGRGRMISGDHLPPTDLSTTRVADGNLLSRLDIDKTISELLREHEGGEHAPPSCPRFSARDGVSWVSSRLDVCDIGCDGEIREHQVCAANGEVNVCIRAASLTDCANCTLIVRVDEQVGISETHGLQEIGQELDSNGL